MPLLMNVTYMHTTSVIPAVKLFSIALFFDRAGHVGQSGSQQRKHDNTRLGKT